MILSLSAGLGSLVWGVRAGLGAGVGPVTSRGRRCPRPPHAEPMAAPGGAKRKFEEGDVGSPGPRSDDEISSSDSGDSCDSVTPASARTREPGGHGDTRGTVGTRGEFGDSSGDIGDMYDLTSSPSSTFV